MGGYSRRGPGNGAVERVERLCFLLNFTSEPKSLTLNESTFDLLEERKVHGQAEVPPYGVCLVRL